MTSRPLVKLPFYITVLLGIMIASLACRTESSTAGEFSLVWEAWGVVKSSYVEGDALDSQRASGKMITMMLDATEKPSYPFLTELERVRGRPPRDVPGELTDVWRAWTLFGEKWPDIASKVLADAALEGMLDLLHGQSAAHLSIEAYERALEKLKGSYEGIGAYVSILDGKIVLAPMEGGPAIGADLKPGDSILAVDGERVDDKSLQEVVNQVRGPAGSKVKLLIERPGVEEPLEFDIIRGNIDMASVERRLLPGAIGYIYISDFRDNTKDDVLDYLEELKRYDILALILDLRSNSGGSLESAHGVVSQFLSDGLFMYEIDREGDRNDWLIEQGGIATDAEKLPMVVMVNGLTASAAEAVAGALQDAQRAKILGSRTFGKGSASAFLELSDGSAVYIPVSHWYTPSGRLIEGTGIDPDIEAAFTAQDRDSGIDSQLRKAYGYLDDQLPRFR